MSYRYHDDDTLFKLLDSHEKRLNILSIQAAQFGRLHVPPHIKTEITAEKRAISAIEREFRRRGSEIAYGDEPEQKQASAQPRRPPPAHKNDIGYLWMFVFTAVILACMIYTLYSLIRLLQGA